MTLLRCSARAAAAAAGRARRHCSGSPPQAGEGECGGEGGWARRVVAGLQPSGALHVGNYFGCVRRLVGAQERGEDVTVFVADLHALTAQRGGGGAGGGGGGLGERSLELAAYLLASGLDPARSTLFVQSAVARHAELCWVLACLCSHARLAHLPQYRERVAAAGGDAGRARLGALLYPVLQAADVLVYRGTHVPVGADQLQHLQLAAQLVRTFHHQYGRAFPTPRALLPEDGGERVRSLRAPERKMSKSDPDGKSRLLLADPDEALRRKLRKAVTDFEPRVTYEPAARPGVANLVALHCLAAGKTPEEVVEECDQLTTAQYKEVVSAAVCDAVRPVRERAQALLARPGALRDALRTGAARARRRADETYAHVSRLVGLAPAARPDPRLEPAPAPAQAPAEQRANTA